MNGIVLDGRLHMMWSYSEHVHRRPTIETLANEFIRTLRELIAHCRSPDAGGYTPSDFPLANLSQDELDTIVARDSVRGSKHAE